MKLMSILIIEGRKEDLNKKYSEKFKEYPEQLNFVLNISDLTDFNHKYTDFVLKHLNPNSSEDEVEDIVELVKNFDKLQKNLEKKDINQYKSIDELKITLNDYFSKSQERKKIGGAKKIYEDDRFLVVKPETLEASCKYGSNTKWCVTQKGTDYFNRYTSGNQALYYIINKKNSTNKKFSKVAVHFNGPDNYKYWDSLDSPLDSREIEVLEYAFPEMISAINSDYKKHSLSANEIFLQEVFSTLGESKSILNNYLNSKVNLIVSVTGFNYKPEIGSNLSEAKAQIILNDEESSKLIDEYTLFLNSNQKNEKIFTTSVGFWGDTDITGEDVEDLELDEWGIDISTMFGKDSKSTAESIRDHIARSILFKVKDNPKLAKKVVGTSKVWQPRRFSYGYTFGKNKGLIKKLTDYLDTKAIGTKLDFLESIGKLKSKVVEGKKLYSQSGSNNYLPSSRWRGHFASFFASAKLAGILGYRKVGRNYFLIKGPNFDAFKSGELKAL